MPESGYLPIPAKLAREGVKDMVRISHARMSGTAYGTVVLHVSPEAAVGGPLAFVRSGDRIRLSVRERRLDLDVDAAEFARRRANWQAPAMPARGYQRLYGALLQAEGDCDSVFFAIRLRTERDDRHGLISDWLLRPGQTASGRNDGWLIGSIHRRASSELSERKRHWVEPATSPPACWSASIAPAFAATAATDDWRTVLLGSIALLGVGCC
jgi:hypothetical protein